MKNLFTSLYQAISGKFIALANKIRIYSSPAFWQTKGITALRSFFTNLIDVKPKNKNDYYSVFKWLISKKLAYAIIIIIGLFSLLYLVLISPAVQMPSFLPAGAGSAKAYNYNSVALKFMSGQATILAKDKYVAYTGSVKNGSANGDGTLYDKDGNVVYTGNFEKSMFSGNGTLFYPDGTVEYNGNFASNLFNGKGLQYYPSGAKKYEGEFVQGLYSGEGILHNAAGSPIFSGSFSAGNIVYDELVKKPAAELSIKYTGENKIYSTSNESCVAMTEINSVYVSASGAQTLNGEWLVDTVYVIKDSFFAGSKQLGSVNDLTRHFGQPQYHGWAKTNLAEAVCNNMRADTPQISIKSTSTIDGVYDVSSYDTSIENYIYSYEANGLLYTFYCADAASGFYMYSIA